MKKIIVFFLFASSFSMNVSGSVRDLQKQKKTNQHKISDIKNNIANQKQKSKRVTEEITSINEKIQAAENELDAINENLINSTHRLEQVEKQLNETMEKKLQKIEEFKKRLVYIHENGNFSYFSIVLQSKNFSDLINRLQYIQDILEYNNQLIMDLEEMEKEIIAQKKEIENEKQQIELLKAIQIKKMKELEINLQARTKLKQSIDQDIEKEIEVLKDIEKENAKINQLIIQKQKNTSSKPHGGGRLGYPTSTTRVSSPFGPRIHPIKKTRAMHTGTDFPVPTGSPIFAAEKGTVIASEYMRGYGYTVIIDHGGGLSTLYAHNSKLSVTVGQQVSKGDVIARAGSTGLSTGPHCHFEVRQNGIYQNPMNYLK